MNALLWRLVDVTVPGRRGSRLDHITVTIPAGITAILGPSGAGKTTLLNLLVGFEKNYTGTITRWDSDVLAPGESPGQCRPHSPSAEPRHSESADYVNRLPVFWIPPGHGLWPHLTVRSHLTSILPKPLAGTADQLLRDFDLEPLSRAYPGTLSQGERDRLALARGIAADPQVLILDEPLAHVPDDAAVRYWSRLHVLSAERKISLVFATHDLSVAHREAGQLICLDLGRVAYAGEPEGMPRA